MDVVTLTTQLSRLSGREDLAYSRGTSRSHLDAAKECVNRPKILSRGAQLPVPASSLFDAPAQPAKAEKTAPVKLTFAEAVAYLVQHCLIHLGDIARYQRQYFIASSYYTWAWLTDPTSGHAYNQLAIIESTKAQKQLDSLCYFYVRAVSCEHPFPAAGENLGHIMKMVIGATEGAFSHLFEKTTSLDNLCSVLQTPMLMLLRLHAFARTGKGELCEQGLILSLDSFAITKAASEFAIAVDALEGIYNATPNSLPVPLAERVNSLATTFKALSVNEVPNEALRSLQLRLLKVVAVHAYGLQSKWAKADDEVRALTISSLYFASDDDTSLLPILDSSPVLYLRHQLPD